MKRDAARREVVAYWLGKAADALASARAELAAGRHDFAVNRADYAVFYAASAALLVEGRRFVKHAGLRAAVHRDLVRPGRLEARWGRVFDRLFEARQRADNLELTRFEAEEAAESIENAEGFLAAMRGLMGSGRAAAKKGRAGP